MTKSRSTDEFQLLAMLLRRHREAAGLTQVDMAERLGETQSYVSKCERADRRVDLVQLRRFCRAIKVPLVEFVQEFERLASRPRR
ncbi:MAG: helix-turn-helix transcriptional regulator [Pirellulales bacterium]|nr:helix-turn-helix transcriptional regulator [Pirellulales bacterium]